MPRVVAARPPIPLRVNLRLITLLARCSKLLAGSYLPGATTYVEAAELRSLSEAMLNARSKLRRSRYVSIKRRGQAAVYSSDTHRLISIVFGNAA